MRAIILGIYQKDILAHNLCDFTAILLMDSNADSTEACEEFHDNSDNSE